MINHYDPLTPEDYAEPKCLLGGEAYGKTPEIKSVPQRRIVEKVNDYMSRRDYAGVERHLNYWLEEARLGHDLRGELTIRNELIGHYRKVGNKEKAFENIEEAISLVEVLDFEESMSGAVTFVNAGTACNAFDEHFRAVRLFKKAGAVMEKDDNTDPAFSGGLYNNMALAYVSLHQYGQAYEMYEKAMTVMGKVPNGCLEQAITLINIANAKEYEYGLEEAEEEIASLMERAYALLDTQVVPRDGYYAFVCEKCAPAFSYYGFFADAAELQRRSEEIYAGT